MTVFVLSKVEQMKSLNAKRDRHQGPVSQSSSQAQVRRVSAELETCLNGDGDEDGFLGGA